MMRKNNIIKKNYEINTIIKKNNKIKNKFFYIYKDENNLKTCRFAICISKKVGNAVKRNKLKRQIKDIIDKSNFVFSYSNDYVIIIRNEINKLNYNEIKENLMELISKMIN